MKKTIKIILSVIIYLACGAVIFRACVMTGDNVLTKIIPNDSLVSAYSADAELSFVTHDPVQANAANGYFHLSSLVYAPDIGHVQVTVRYNTSVYSYVGTAESTPFTFTLYNTATGETVTAAVLGSAERYGRYKYERLAFDGVDDCGDGAWEFVMYSSDGTSEYSRAILHSGDTEFKAYNLSGGEKRTLAGD